MPKSQINILPIFKRKSFLFALIGIIAFTFYWYSLPNPLVDVTDSTVLKDKDGALMGAKIAEDEQWRFPISEFVPMNFEEAIIEIEDKTFRIHPGVDPTAIARAIVQNYKADAVVSGASTLSMQVIRLSRNKDRTVSEKVKEMMLALRLEFTHSKDEIMAFYAAHAPFGGNVVGLEAASWRYYGLPPHELSWSQAATLAVLPNAPGLVHPGKNRAILLEKRNKVLKTLFEHQKIDAITYELALEEPLIGAPKKLPSLAPHLLEKAIKKGQKGKRMRTTLDMSKQEKFTQILAQHQMHLNHNYIHNSALLV